MLPELIVELLDGGVELAADVGQPLIIGLDHVGQQPAGPAATLVVDEHLVAEAADLVGELVLAGLERQPRRLLALHDGTMLLDRVVQTVVDLRQAHVVALGHEIQELRTCAVVLEHLVAEAVDDADEGLLAGLGGGLVESLVHLPLEEVQGTHRGSPLHPVEQFLAGIERRSHECELAVGGLRDLGTEGLLGLLELRFGALLGDRGDQSEQLGLRGLELRVRLHRRDDHLHHHGGELGDHDDGRRRHDLDRGCDRHDDRLGLGGLELHRARPRGRRLRDLGARPRRGATQLGLLDDGQLQLPVEVAEVVRVEGLEEILPAVQCAGQAREHGVVELRDLDAEALQAGVVDASRAVRVADSAAECDRGSQSCVLHVTLQKFVFYPEFETRRNARFTLLERREFR